MVGFVRLTMQNAIVNKLGLPTTLFLRYFNNNVLKAIETALNNQQEQIDRLNAALRNTSHTEDLTLASAAAGATASIAITAHRRVYTDRTVELDGDTITGLDYDTTYSVYYDDAAREGGAVTYVATTTATEAVTSGTHPNRHLLGLVTTPATSGDPPTSGSGSVPAGFPSYVYNWKDFDFA